MKGLTFFADVIEIEDVMESWRSMNSSTLGPLLVCCAVGLVSLLAIVWVVFFRKSGRRKRSRRHSHRQAAATPESLQAPSPAASAPAPPEQSGRKRSRRRRRSRNPTLAEVGGLPPIRSELPPGPQA